MSAGPLQFPEDTEGPLLCACGSPAVVGLEARWFCAACFDAAFEKEIRPVLQRLREDRS